jgi:hypothetical protein
MDSSWETEQARCEDEPVGKDHDEAAFLSRAVNKSVTSDVAVVEWADLNQPGSGSDAVCPVDLDEAAGSFRRTDRRAEAIQ